MTDPITAPFHASRSNEDHRAADPSVPVVKDRVVQPSGNTNGGGVIPPWSSTTVSNGAGQSSEPKPIPLVNPPEPVSSIISSTQPHLTLTTHSTQPNSHITNGTSHHLSADSIRPTVPTTAPAPPVHTTPQSLEKRFTSEEKGKGRAPLPAAAVTVASTENGNGNASSPTSSETAEGRGKREKKKRRLSATGEIDPSSIHDEHEHQKRKKREDAPLRPQSSTPAPIATTLPLSADDKAFFARVEANKSKPPLSEMSGPCPVWSNTRKGFQSAVEYLRNPTRTGGASVDIGPGGQARGVILEGQAPTDLNLWTLERARTLLLPIGRPRARRRADSQKTVKETSSHQTDPAANGSNVTPTDPGVASVPTSPPIKREPESTEIEALLMTHRARVPLALSVAQDYSAVPFRVPRPFIALGFFWIVDAWLEPVVTVRSDRPDSDSALPELDAERVVWRFRFEYSEDSVRQPWWQTPSLLRDEAPCPFMGHTADAQTWSVVSPDLSPTDTIRPTQSPSHAAQQLDHIYTCPSCDHRSTVVYSDVRRCLNESCERWTIGAAIFQKAPVDWRRVFVPNAASDVKRITPHSLTLTLRPAEPRDVDTRAMNQQVHAGREYWTGWVCHKCGSANERKKWHGWNCEACKRTLVPRHIVYNDDSLRAPLRPVSIGPRPDDGLASWPFDASFAWTLFDDDVKVVRHGVENGFGAGTAVYHSLNHEGPKLSQRRINAKSLFRELQRRAESAIMAKEMPYRRHIANSHAPRLSERHLSPFYTVLLGPEPAPEIESLPVGRPIPWREAEETFLNLADYINERAGQIFPGEAERFNSLLVAVNPPDLSATQAPRIFVPAHAFMSFTFLGSDGVLKLRRPAGTAEGKSKQGQMTLQHGDVVGVQTGSNGLEVCAQQDGFGFLCIGRQIYRTDNDPLARTSSPGMIAKVTGQSRKPPNKPPPRPAKLPHVPLTYWYVGPFPLDPERPLKVHPSMRERPNQAPIDPASEHLDLDLGDGEKIHTGIEIVAEDAEQPKRLDPPARPGEGAGRKRKPTAGSEGTTTGSEKSKGRRKSVPAKVDKDKQGGGGKAQGSPAKKKARKSMA